MRYAIWTRPTEGNLGRSAASLCRLIALLPPTRGEERFTLRGRITGWFQKSMSIETQSTFVPDKVYRMQSNRYHAVLQHYGLPLDSRHLYTKSDSQQWQRKTAPYRMAETAAQLSGPLFSGAVAALAWEMLGTVRIPYQLLPMPTAQARRRPKQQATAAPTPPSQYNKAASRLGQSKQLPRPTGMFWQNDLSDPSCLTVDHKTGILFVSVCST
ncbi:hypothetical protein CSUB01_10030 [Colletotrichum sublineola]|uniref:Glutaminase A central domain-containing protein n=1 Tax=Colletotrichum sublineola TaxID=1173701 RepID=A0A066XYX3_COLSU|nr:hypothetical protein CSUB01_10030 [Colletotrichum sublineola]